jgi:hypothetical protein
MASDSVVKVSTLGDQTGIGDCVALRIDFAGLEPVDGGLDLRSGTDFEALVNVGGLMYLGHGEKFTRLELRLEGTASTDPKAAKGDSLGV